MIGLFIQTLIYLIHKSKWYIPKIQGFQKTTFIHLLNTWWNETAPSFKYNLPPVPWIMEKKPLRNLTLTSCYSTTIMYTHVNLCICELVHICRNTQTHTPHTCARTHTEVLEPALMLFICCLLGPPCSLNLCTCKQRHITWHWFKSSNPVRELKDYDTDWLIVIHIFY